MVNITEGFHRVIDLPSTYQVLDLTETLPRSFEAAIYTIGKYNERRKNLYQFGLFESETDPRIVHMGIDIGAPVLSSVYSFDTGVIIAQGALPASGDYGHSIVIEYVWRSAEPLRGRMSKIIAGQRYWALYGHLSASSIFTHQLGDHIERGQRIGELGESAENGGWPPHLHFQLSLQRPQTHDMPGVVSERERESALDLYPDPRQVLGSLYT